jgi:hypothetical protein
LEFLLSTSARSRRLKRKFGRGNAGQGLLRKGLGYQVASSHHTLSESVESRVGDTCPSAPWESHGTLTGSKLPGSVGVVGGERSRVCTRCP